MQFSSSTLIIAKVIVIISILHNAQAFKNGGPGFSCRNLRPAHNGGPKVREESPFTLRVTSQIIPLGQSATGIVSSPDGIPFEGLLCSVSMMGRDNAHAPLGTMETRDPNLKPVNCVRSGMSGVTHVNDDFKTEAVFVWTPPANATVGSEYKLRCAVVQNFFNFWNHFEERLVVVDPNQRPPIVPSGTTSEPRRTPGTGRDVPPTRIPGRPTPPTSPDIIIDFNDNNNNGGSRGPVVSGPRDVGGATTGPGRQPPRPLPPGQLLPNDVFGVPGSNPLSLDPFQSPSGNSVQFPGQFNGPIDILDPNFDGDGILNDILNNNRQGGLGSDLPGPLNTREPANRAGTLIRGVARLNNVQGGSGSSVNGNTNEAPGPVVNPPTRRGPRGGRINRNESRNNQRRVNNNAINNVNTRPSPVPPMRPPRRDSNLVSDRAMPPSRDTISFLRRLPQSTLINLILSNSRIRFPMSNNEFFRSQGRQ